MPKCVSFMRKCVQNSKERTIFVTLNLEWVRPFSSYEGIYIQNTDEFILLDGKSTPNIITNQHLRPYYHKRKTLTFGFFLGS